MPIYVSNLRKILFWLSSLLLITPLVVTESTAYPFIVGKSIWFSVVLSFLIIAWGYLCIIDKSFYIKKNFPILIFGLLILSQIISSIFGSSILSSFWGNWWRMAGIVQNTYLFVFSIILISTFKHFTEWISLAKVILFSGLIVSFLGFLETFNFYLSNIFKLPFSIVTYDHQANGVTSTLGTSVYLGWYLGLIILLTIALFAIELNKHKKIINVFNNYWNFIYPLNIFFSIWCLLFNFSRASMISLFISSLFISIIYIFLYPSIKIKFILLSFLIFLILSFSIFISFLFINENNAIRLHKEVVTKELVSIASQSEPKINQDLTLLINSMELDFFYPILELDEVANIVDFPDIERNLKYRELLNTLIDSNIQDNINNTQIHRDIFCSDSYIFQRWLLSYDYGFEKSCTLLGKFIYNIPGNFIHSLINGINTGSRTAAFNSGFNSFTHNPFLGIGNQNFEIAYYKYLDSKSFISSTEIMDDPHNSLLKIFVENGLIGFLLSTILYLFTLIIFLRNITLDKKNKHFWIFLSSILIFYFINSQFTISMLTNRLILIFLISFSIRSFLGFILSNNNKVYASNKINQIALLSYTFIAFSLLIFFIIFYFNMYDSAKKINIDEGISIYEYRDNINQFSQLSSKPRIEMLKKLNLYFETFIERDPKELFRLERLVQEEYKLSNIINPNDYWLNYVTANFYWQAAQFDSKFQAKMIPIVNKLVDLSPDIHATTEMQIKLAIIMNDSENFQKYNIKWKNQLQGTEFLRPNLNIFDSY